MKVAKAGVTKQERERRAKLFEQGIKICYKCKEEKTLDCFSKRSASKDGISSFCRECKRKYDLKNLQMFHNYYYASEIVILFF